MDNRLNNRIDNQNTNNKQNGVQSFVWSNYAVYNREFNSDYNIDVQKNGLYTEEDKVFIDNDNVVEIKFSNNHNKFFNIISNRKFLVAISVMTFIFTSITVCKTFALKDSIEEYEEHYVEIENKQSSEAVISNDLFENEEIIMGGAAEELIRCIKSPLSNENVPNSIKNIINEINTYYNQSNNYFSFKYKDIYTGFSVSYNENQNIFTASTIKAPKDIYIYEMASLGKINLSDKLVYTSNYANTGAWRLNQNKFNTEYDIKTLVEYSTVSSDNAAHNMLMDHFGRNNMLSFWNKLGTTAIFTVNSNWGVTNARDASIYMEELYRFYIEDEKYGQELMNNFLNARPKFINGKNDYKVANKSGYAGSAIHDVSIVFADNPYIVVALSNLGDTDYYMSYFNNANDFAYRLHTEYWKYKMEVCENINQY